MKNKALIAKQAKAEKYVSEPDRFTLMSIQVSLRSDHGTRVVYMISGVWNCPCDYFQGHSTCSHVIAVKAIYGIGG